MTATHGRPPDENGESRAITNPAPAQQSDDTTATQPQRTTCVRRGSGGHTGRYAHAWREGYCYGFLGALRLAARRTDNPDMWVMLSTLADDYELAAGDE